MLRRLVLALVLSVPALASAQRAPAYCERSIEEHDWPVAGEPQGRAPATPIDRPTARRLVETFRRGWRRLTVPRGVLRDFRACLLASAEHFVLRRVETATVGPRVRQLDAMILGGAVDALPAGWSWEVYWGGASRRYVPSGPLGGYLSQDGRRVLLMVQWPEG